MAPAGLYCQVGRSNAPRAGVGLQMRCLRCLSASSNGWLALLVLSLLAYTATSLPTESVPGDDEGF